MKYLLRRWRHIIFPGHGYMIHYDITSKRRWYSDGIGKVYVCRCGKRWYH